MKDSNKRLYIRLANVIIIVLALLYYNQVLGLHQELAKANDTIEKLSTQSSASASHGTGKYKDGTYQGSAQGFGGAINVEVTVENGNISDIQVLSADGEDASYYNSALSVLDSIMEKQSAEVDTVSGATYSSTGLINATKQALGKAE